MSRFPKALLLLALVPLALRADGEAKITRGENTLDLHVGEESVGKYQFAGTVALEKEAGTKPLAKPFLWPLNAPGNIPVTRGWPMIRKTPGETVDHFHQKSVWFCHGDVIPEGIELKVKSADKHVKGVDFWSEGVGHGRIVTVAVRDPKQISPNHAAVVTVNAWTAPDGQKILDETRTIHLVSLPTGRLVIFDIDLTASVCPVTFGDTKEGAMGVRVHDAIRSALKDGGTLTNSLGKSGEKDVWGLNADWCDYYGPIGGKVAGLAVFDDPKNPYRAYWHARGYGLMAANPFGRNGSGFPGQKGKTDLVRLDKGQSLHLRYGVYAHQGTTAEAKVADVYKTFCEMK